MVPVRASRISRAPTTIRAILSIPPTLVFMVSPRMSMDSETEGRDIGIAHHLGDGARCGHAHPFAQVLLIVLGIGQEDGTDVHAGTLAHHHLHESLGLDAPGPQLGLALVAL